MTIKRPNGIYRANFTFTHPTTGKRKRCRVSLGTKNRSEALKREAQLRIESEQAVLEVGNHKQAPFSGFARKWLEEHIKTDCKHSYYQSTEKNIRVHLYPFFRETNLRSIRVEQVQAFKTQQVNKGLKPKTINNQLSILSSLLQTAVVWEYADDNPARRVRKLPVPPKPLKHWKIAQSDAFLEAVQNLRPEWYAFFLCALRTGLRLGELLALRWVDVDFDTGFICVVENYTHGKVGSPKSGKIRKVPMTRGLQAALKAHKHRRGKLVFCTEDGGYLNRNRVKHPFRICTRAAGVPKIRIHDLRHTFASQLAVNGVSIAKIQQYLGHADIRQTMKYAHLSPEEIANHVEVLEPNSCPNSAPSG
jgi:integrase